MENFWIILYSLLLILTLAIPVYLFGRVWFALSPFFINYYQSEKNIWYNGWNTNRFVIIILLTAVSISLSIFWGKRILQDIPQMKIELSSILFYLLLQLICFVLLEQKMEHPFKPYLAYKLFSEKKYNERFVFKEENNLEDKIGFHTNEIKKEIQYSKESLSEEIEQHKNISKDIHQLATENSRLLKTSDFPFEIRNTAHIILSDVMEDYFISQESADSLSDFLLRNRKNKKIVFTKVARNGVSVQPILDFFSRYTDLIEKCRANAISQADTVKIINELAVANDKHNIPVSNPINSKNLSKYLS